jgi:predicted lipoprotein with Yx(FWY)xxD motif/catechol 2,3-dioxygenase-like lactoylglutathione lyase family enzyme
MSSTRPRLVGINHVALEVGDLERALAFYGEIFQLGPIEREPGMAFVEMGDQFLALSEGRGGAPDRERHFGLVVDDKQRVREALSHAGVEVSPPPRLNFRDPWGNHIQIVDYREIQFTKAPEVLAAMGISTLRKTPAKGSSSTRSRPADGASSSPGADPTPAPASATSTWRSSRPWRGRLTGLRRRTKLLLGVSTVMACLAGCAGYLYVRYLDVVRYSAEQGRVTVERADLGQLGPVLVTNKGFALYMFPPDAARQVTCTGHCAFAWPPLTLHAGQTLAAGAGVRAALLGSVPNPGGGRVVTYHGWPLYTYLGDASPGHAAGQGADDDGGYWYVIRPSGQIVESNGVS